MVPRLLRNRNTPTVIPQAISNKLAGMLTIIALPENPVYAYIIPETCFAAPLSRASLKV
jgi:hypothetical protein